MRKVELPAGHEVINSDELRTLRRKERSHDAYIWATRRMADERRDVHQDERLSHDYRGGYTTAIRDFSRFVVEAPIPD